jgi:hypothetical protein
MVAAFAHLIRVSIEARSHSLKDGSCCQREIRRSLPVVHWPFSEQPWQALVQ